MTAVFQRISLFILSAIALCACSTPMNLNNATDDSVDRILNRHHTCSETLVLRSQALSKEQETITCQQLSDSETKFHLVFSTQGKPVKNDLNTSLRANIYQSNEDFVKYATKHFDMPTNNGGMYLEGLPDQAGNHAEFVANQKMDGGIRNLGHEYIHYLDGRFNLYGDFCANLHDSHSPPENCAKPAPLTPYLVWWSEGIAEYISRGNINPEAIKMASSKTYALSQLFDTGYESNSDGARVYSWGYLAVRFMMEKHRTEIEKMLGFTRTGDYPRYQSLVRSWGTKMDTEFSAWLDTLDASAK